MNNLEPGAESAFWKAYKRRVHKSYIALGFSPLVLAGAILIAMPLSYLISPDASAVMAGTLLMGYFLYVIYLHLLYKLTECPFCGSFILTYKNYFYPTDSICKTCHHDLKKEESEIF